MTKSYIKSCKLNRKSCISICTDRVESMIGSVKGLTARVKECNPNFVTTHCFLHRETLIFKSSLKTKNVFQQVIKTVNFSKSRQQKS